ncbi:phosphonate C-P lyase system protein PhnH [Vaginisenegalia massiliensis]|uniref:phosphonate C-P lyase system protein PhnH n=1 Tax=Vaginisenegalia massiliensis TaxID=2058294 RepID=UPI000F528F40|nr:phosphonate C-P lyase system protein PhnH [Vaginisenegalia massiliensis]
MESIFRMQANFRQLVEAMAYPGDCKSLSLAPTYQKRWDEEGNLPSAGVFAVMEVLIDQEVKAMTLPRNKAFEAELSIYANSQITTDIQQADYIAISHDFLMDSKAFDDLNQLSIGNLEDPDQSASLIIEVDKLGDQDANYQLTGPGIKETKAVYLPLSEEFVHWRQTMNREFPLGIDVILVDPAGECLALPRTTKIQLHGRD